MVDITIYIEGVQSEDPAVLTIDNSTVFRESFYHLFTQKLSSTEFNLRVQPFGTITQTRKMLAHVETQRTNAAFLIDLDAPKEKREERIAQYKPFDTTKIFFMIQEMEAWILSQVDKIEEFGRNEGLIRKRKTEEINGNVLIKDKHPEQIDKPSEKLDTILRQYFDIIKIKCGKMQKIGKRYSKAKDGAQLIGLLDLQLLMQSFDEATRLIDYIKNKNVSL